MTNRELSELIKQNTRTILPGFGAFLVKDSDKGFLAENVTFSPFLRYNDGMLEDYLAKSKGISKDEAGNQIASLTENIKEELLSKGYYQVGELGFLNKDSRGTVSFTIGNAADITSPKTTEEKTVAPSKPSVSESKPTEENKTVNVDSISESDTLDLISETEITQDEPTTSKQSEKHTVQPTPTKSAPTAKHTTPSKKTPSGVKKSPDVNQHVDKPTSNEPPKKRKQSPVVYVAAFAGIVVAIAASMFLIKTLVLDSNNTSGTDTDAKEKAAFAKEMDKVNKELGTQSNEKTTEPAVAKSDTPTPTKSKAEETTKIAQSKKVVTEPKAIAPTGNYHLVVGSFQNADYASSYAKELTEKGFGARVIIRSNGMSAVTIGTYTTYEAAKEDLARKKKAFPNGWVLKQ